MKEEMVEEPQMSEAELQEKKDEMLKFYNESMPYLEAQLAYEKMLLKIDKARFQRTSIQVQYAMMMNAGAHDEEDMPSHEELAEMARINMEQDQSDESPAKPLKRPLKKK